MSVGRFTRGPAQFPVNSPPVRASHGKYRHVAEAAYLRRPQAYPALGNARDDRAGGGAESGGRRCDRPQRRRTRFRHPRFRQGSGDRGDPERPDQIYPGRWHRGAEGSDPRQVPPRQRARLWARPDHGQRRRQAHVVQRARRDGRQGRRGHHSRALLGQLSRHRRLCRRHPGDHCRHRGAELQDHSGATRCRDHLENALGDVQLAVEPVGRRLFGRRARRTGRGHSPPPACDGDDRRYV